MVTNEEKFERSIAFSLKWEGGRNFIIINGKPVVQGAAKADAGGATAYGVTWATLKAAHKAGIVSHDDICKLIVEEAKLIYKNRYWDKYGWNELEWPACLCCLDCCINHGGFASILQKSVALCGQYVIIDGKFGPKTFAALKACEPVRLSEAIHKERVKYYHRIVTNKPSQKVFLKGWLRRADEMLKETRR